MAVSAKTCVRLAPSLGLCPGDMQFLVEHASQTGSATGYTDVEDSPFCGVLVTVRAIERRAEHSLYTIELH